MIDSTQRFVTRIHTKHFILSVIYSDYLLQKEIVQ